MKWPQELDRLLPLVRKYILRYCLLSLIKAITILAMVNIPLQILGGVMQDNPSYGFIFITLNLLTLLVSLVYFYLHRPRVEEIALVLDKQLETKERIITFLEYEKESESKRGITAMRGEVKSFISKVKLSFDWDKKKFKSNILTATIMILILIASILVAPQISQSIERESGLKEKQQEVVAEIDEVLKELLEIDQEKYDQLIEELEALKDIAQNAKESEELEIILKELEELLLKELEDQQEMLKDISKLRDLLGTSTDLENELKDNPLLKEELLERIENLQDHNLSTNQRERLQELSDALSTNPTTENLAQLGELLEELQESNGTAPLEEMLGEGANGPGSEVEPGPGESPGEGSDGPGGEGEGSQGGEGGEGEGQGSGSSPTGGDTSTPEDYVYIPSDKELVLDGDEGEYTLRDIMRMNPNIINSPYKDIYKGYHKEAITSVTGLDIPKPLEDYVRKYFQSIAP